MSPAGLVRTIKVKRLADEWRRIRGDGKRAMYRPRQRSIHDNRSSSDSYTYTY
jgi:hypothetical protein